MASLLFSKLACYIWNLANKHGITSIPAYIPTCLNVEANYLSLWSVESSVAPAFSHSSGFVSSLGSVIGGSVGILLYQSMSVLLHLGMSSISGCLGVECFNQPWIYQAKYVSSFSFSSLVLSTFLKKCVTGQFRHLIQVAPCSVEILVFPQFSTCWQMILLNVPL